MNFTKTGIIWIAVAAAAVGQVTRVKPSSKTRLVIDAESRRYAAGAPVSGEFHLVVGVLAHSLQLRVEGSGALAGSATSMAIVGPSRGPESRSVPFEWKPTPGEGSATVTVDVLTANGKVIDRVSRVLYILNDGTGTSVSSASETGALRRKLENAANSTKPFDAQSIATRGRMITSTPVVGRVVGPVEAPSAAEKRLQELLGQKRAESKPDPASVSDGRVTLTGRICWTDAGNQRHGLPMATVEVRVPANATSTLVATASTNATGEYAVSFASAIAGLGVFIRVLARSSVAEVMPDDGSTDPYRIDSPVIELTGPSMTVNLTSGNGSDSDAAFSVHHALVMMGGYASSLAGQLPARIVARFPTEQSTSLFDGTALHILRQDKWDWDVIGHEYGHYFQELHRFVDHPGGAHAFGQHNATAYGKDAGLRLAWGEGWATFFAIAGQVAMNASTLGIANVGDTRYQDTEDSALDEDLEPMTGVGEDDEASVAASLWDIVDAASDGADMISMNARDLFVAFKAARPTTIGTAWAALAGMAQFATRSEIGAVLGQCRVAPEQVRDPGTTSDATTPPRFAWKRNGGGDLNPLDSFEIEFFKGSDADPFFEKALGDTDTYTPSAEEWQRIKSGGSVKWVIEGRSSKPPTTPSGALGYWSGSGALSSSRTDALKAPHSATEPPIAAPSDTRPNDPDQVVSVIIHPGKPGAPKEVIEVATRDARSQVFVTRIDPHGRILESESRPLDQATADRIWKFVEQEQIFSFAPVERESGAADYGLRQVRLQRRHKSATQAGSHDIVWKRPLENGDALNQLIKSVGATQREARTKVNLQYFPE